MYTFVQLDDFLETGQGSYVIWVDQNREVSSLYAEFINMCVLVNLWAVSNNSDTWFRVFKW
jgi:hypothetical protein